MYIVTVILLLSFHDIPQIKDGVARFVRLFHVPSLFPSIIIKYVLKIPGPQHIVS